MDKEIVYKFDNKPKPGFICRACRGLGTYQDGGISIGPVEVRIAPATKCEVCNGTGRENPEAETAQLKEENAKLRDELAAANLRADVAEAMLGRLILERDNIIKVAAGFR